ncbi:hypothetical protein [Flavobacterium cerinum]|uniref:T9SS sorting signal type C domain-containing protein n=1 Tax=Flavobacterium cerinum TaxID=2502784 RepID=A0ABY5IPQ5_9FLAO|nr:hypothetical protein [Flavobacterium cerinum]UUC44817.1 hypothetical protein NOX80_14420 [Flavobacterium cerinum]
MLNSFKNTKNPFQFLKKKATYKILVILLFGYHTVYSQQVSSDYIYSYRTSNYTAIDHSNATNAFPSNTSWSNIAALAVPIGFTFNFNGINYSNCTIVSNGFIAFGNTNINIGLITNPISSNESYDGAVSALGTNLMSINQESRVIYQTIGSFPNRTFVVQWGKVKAATRNGYFNFQIHLNEGNNTIDVIFGPATPTTGEGSFQVGLRGADNSDFNNRNKELDWNYTLSGSSNTAAIKSQNSSHPSSGLTYSWKPIYKKWNGTDHNWNNPSNWLPVGVPSTDNNVFINPTTTNNYPIVSGIAQAGKLTVKGRLDIVSGAIRISNKIDVQQSGSFTVHNNAEIIQTDNDVQNSGIVAIKRTTRPMYRYDFTYWNSPVTLSSGFTLGMLSPNTLADKYMKWQPTLNGGGNGNWTSVNANTVMDPKTGYIVRAPQSFNLNPNNKTPYTATFTGTPNNGDLLVPIIVGTMSGNDDQWNLIGNPYPSAIDVMSFVNNTSNMGLLDGTIYLWTHNSPPSGTAPNPFYGSYTYNYTASDYATINLLGATVTALGNPVPSRYIASGQSFFIKGLRNGNALFSNYIRVIGNNNHFMKTGNTPNGQTISDEAVERKRIWLNLTNKSGTFSQILIGYDKDATLDFDRGLDGELFGGNEATLYSIIPDNQLAIQARPLPFNNGDQVELGYKTEIASDYEIGIDHFDAFFENKTIYLEDKITNTIHDLKTAPYSFISDSGAFNDRFILRFNNITLGHNSFSPENSIQIVSRDELTVSSSIEKIKDLTVYDLLGRKIDEYLNTNENEIVLKNVKKISGVILLKITLENGTTLYRKTFF